MLGCCNTLLHKQKAKPPAEEGHGPATVKPSHSLRKRISSVSKARAEAHKRSDIRSFWRKKPEEEQPVAAATSTPDGKEQQAKKATTDGDTAVKLPSLRTLCWIVMGLTTVQDDAELLRNISQMS